MTTRAVIVGGRTVPQDTQVWLLGDASPELVEIEHKGSVGRVSRKSVVKLPVARPQLAVLRKLDPCFGLPREAFELEHHDQAHYFEILRCKSHGSRFLCDTRGGIALYERTILLSEEDSEDAFTIWRRYHEMSDDWLNLLGIAL